MDNNNENKKSVVDKTAEVVQKVQKVKKNLKRIRWVASLLPSLPVLGYGLLIFLCLVVAMAPVLYWGEIKAGIKNFITETTEAIASGTERTLNLITFQGWESNESLFFINLEKANREYSEKPNIEDELDLSLVAATVHYGKFMPTVDDFEAAGEIDVDTPEYEEYDEDSTSSIIPVSQLRHFYKVANDRLGRIDGNQGILGNLVGAKIIMQCYPTGDNVFETVDSAVEWLASVGNTVFSYAKSSLANILKNSNIVGNSINEIATMYSYSREDQSYLKSRYLELVNGISNSKIQRAVESSDFSINCGTSEIALPTVYYFMDYENYKEYLKTTYLPVAIASELRGRNTAEINEIINETIEEIFIMKETVDGLFEDQSFSFGFGGDPIYHIAGVDNFSILFPAGINIRVSSEYGNRIHPKTGLPSFHYGIDLAGPSGGPSLDGVPVLAATSGTVTEVDTRCATGRGCWVEISHDLDNDGVIEYYTRYLHLQKGSIKVSKGQRVSPDQEIGLVGSTGMSTGPHLHFEILSGANKSALEPRNHIMEFAPNNTVSELLVEGGSTGTVVNINKGTVISRGEMEPYCPGCESIQNVSCPVSNILYNTSNKSKYNDGLFGELKVLSADINLFPCGTIIEVTNHNNLEDFKGIVLNTDYQVQEAVRKNRIFMKLAFSNIGTQDWYRSKQLSGSPSLIFNNSDIAIDNGLRYEVIRYGWN